MTKIQKILRELDWSGQCPIHIKDQVRFALMEVDGYARQEERLWVVEWLKRDQRFSVALDVAEAFSRKDIIR